MEIGEVGRIFSSTSEISYLSDDSLLEFDALILDFHYFFTEYRKEHTNRYLRKKAKLEEFVKYKKMPLIFFMPLNKLNFVLYENGNPIVPQFDFYAPVPVLDIEIEKGFKANIIPKTPFSDFFKKYKEAIYYDSYLNSPVGNTILETELTKKSLAFYNENCIFIPRFNLHLIEYSQAEFLTDLISAARNCISQNEEISLPEWSDRFYLPGEIEIKSSIEEKLCQIESLNKELELDQESLNRLKKRKYLFCGTGSELEIEVENIFKEIGFEIIDSRPGRDDLILKYNDKIFVVEIKGVSKTAAEKHSAQLEKWSADYFENHEVLPKALLIVNSFNNTPLNERTNPTFPDQMLPYSKQRNHCLLSTIQLLNIYYTIQNEGDGVRENLIDQIYSTTGELEGFKDWNEYITKDS